VPFAWVARCLVVPLPAPGLYRRVSYAGGDPG